MSETGDHDDERERVAASRPPVNPAAFSAAWAKAEPRLFSHLVRRRGLSDEAAADVCQEVALRAVLYRVEFRIPTDLFRYGLVVGNRLANNLLAEHELLQTDPLPDAADAEDDDMAAAVFDVEDDAAARWALHTALAAASEADKLALRTLFGKDPPEPQTGGKRERDRLALQRLRAKRRLRARLDELFDDPLGVLGFPVLARLARSIARNPAARVPLATAAVATVAGGILGGFAVGGAGVTGGSNDTPAMRAALTAAPVQASTARPDPVAAAPHRPGGTKSPSASPQPQPPRRPVEVAVKSGKVTVDAEATTPAGTTKDLTVVTIRCDWWIAGTVCDLAP